MPDDFSQDSRAIRVTTPLAKDTLLLEGVVGAEELSRLYRFELTMLAKETATVSFDRLLGQGVTVELGDPGEPVQRYIHGVVAAVSEGESEEGADGKRFTRYRAEVVPKVWYLTKTARSRIFQQLSVVDILKKVFAGQTVQYKTQVTYEPRDYCVQYRESDWDFAARLMEDEGIWFYFEHANGSHTLILADGPQSHPTLPAPATVPYIAGGGKPGAADTGEVVLAWKKTQAVRTGTVTLRDYTFETPENATMYEATAVPAATVSIGTVAHKRTAGQAADLELYDFPGGYADRFDGIAPGGGEQAAKLSKIAPDGKRTAAVRVQAEAVSGLIVEGESDVRRFAPGYKFSLSKHPNADGEYALVRVEHAADITGSYTAGQAVACLYRNQFVAVPGGVPFRPDRRTPRPRAEGPQSAVVVGPPGQEIFCDKYGRVKVQFRWDREGKNNAESSCWVRTVTPWAGGMWGHVQIPRIGHEVLVGFEDGNPDRPVILGSTFNAATMPPYELSKFATKSGFKTHSTPDGKDTNFNELRFEDKKGKEQVYFHAERDFDRVVENNDTVKIGYDTKEAGDRTVQIFNNEAITIGGGKGQAKDGSQTVSIWKDRSVTLETGNDTLLVSTGNRLVTISKGNLGLVVTKGHREAEIKTGNETLKVTTGNRLVQIDTGNDTHKIATGNREVSIDTGNDKLTVATGNVDMKVSTGNVTNIVSIGNVTTKVSAGSFKVEAGTMIELKVGANSIKIDATGITMTATMVKVQAQAMVTVKGPIVQLTADAMMVIKGGITMIN